MTTEIRYDEPPHDTCEALAWFRARVKELEARLRDLAETHQRTLDRLFETERRLAALLEIQGQGGHTSERDGGIGEVGR